MSRYFVTVFFSTVIKFYSPVKICHYLNRVQCLQLSRIVTMIIGSVQITSVRKAGLTIYESLWLGTQKSVRCRYWTGVRIKRVNFRENTWAFCRDRNCPYKAGVRIKRASVERGSTVLQKPFKQELKLTKLLFNIFAASLLYTKCLLKNPAEVL